MCEAETIIKQGIVQDTIADINGPLPPLNNLPQWARVNTLDKARYPKPFLKDRLQPLPNPPPKERRDSDESFDQELEISENMNPILRIQHLEKSINFLRSQHEEVLTSLHEEIDRLKRENKELHFKLVMVIKQGSAPSSPSAAKKRDSQAEVQGVGTEQAEKELSSLSLKSQSKTQDSEQSQDEKLDELKIIFLEEEIKELKHALQQEQNKNVYLTKILDRYEKQQRARQQHMSTVETVNASPSSPGQQMSPPSGAMQETILRHQPAPPPPQPHHGYGQTQQVPVISMQHINFSTSPFQIQLPSQPPRPPTLAECDVIMRHLQSINDQQAHELNRLKTDLRDVLYSHKWTPDAYLLAKAYIAQDDEREASEKERFPKIQLKNQSRKLPDIAYMQKDAVSLPALKQTVGNKAVERRKRTQILQKARLRKEVLQ